jgi:hypothetical protein
MNKDTRTAWMKDCMVRRVKLFHFYLVDLIAQGLVDQADDQIMKLLTCEWLVSYVEDTSGKKHPPLYKLTLDLNHF